MHDQIVIQDRQDVIAIRFADVEKYHGYTNIAGAAVGFKALQAAFDALFPGQPAPREETAVVSGHPGSGVRDAIELVTRASTRGAYNVDATLPKARLNPHRKLSFSFFVKRSTGHTAEVVLREGILPRRFFDLMELTQQPNAESEQVELDQLKRTLARTLVATPSDALFVVAVTT